MRRGSVLVAVAGPLPKFKEAITDPFGRINIALTLIICLIGLIWQIYTVSADYFAYSVVSEVYIEKRDDVIPPALSLCLPYADVVEDNMIDVQKRWKSDRYISMEMQEHLTISELFEVTRHLKFFAESAWVRKKNSYNVSVGWSYLNVVKYLKDYYACYKISNVDADTPNFHWRSHHISFGRNPGAQMGIYLNKRKLQKVSRASVVLTEVNDYPRGDRDFPLNLFDDSTSSNDDGDVADDDNSVEGTGIFTDSATFWSLAYTKVTQKLLPPPFMTACRNFRPQFESRYECIDDCVIEKSLAEFNQSIFIVTFTKPGKYGNITVLSKKKLKDDPHLEKRVDKIIDECSGMCKGQDCLKVYFMPILLSKLDDDQRVIFTLFDMNGPETSLLFHKKTPFTSYLVYLLSIVGVWLGLSCLDIVRHTMGAVRKRYVWLSQKKLMNILMRRNMETLAVQALQNQRISRLSGDHHNRSNEHRVRSHLSPGAARGYNSPTQITVRQATATPPHMRY